MAEGPTAIAKLIHSFSFTSFKYASNLGNNETQEPLKTYLLKKYVSSILE